MTRLALANCPIQFLSALCLPQNGPLWSSRKDPKFVCRPRCRLASTATSAGAIQSPKCIGSPVAATSVPPNRAGTLPSNTAAFMRLGSLACWGETFKCNQFFLQSSEFSCVAENEAGRTVQKVIYSTGNHQQMPFRSLCWSLGPANPSVSATMLTATQSHCNGRSHASQMAQWPITKCYSPISRTFPTTNGVCDAAEAPKPNHSLWANSKRRLSTRSKCGASTGMGRACSACHSP